jgi:hypothetical protein
VTKQGIAIDAPPSFTSFPIPDLHETPSSLRPISTLPSRNSTAAEEETPDSSQDLMIHGFWILGTGEKNLVYLVI